MSMDQPNIYETAIEEYAEAVRRQDRAERDLEKATKEMNESRDDRQDKWRVVKAHRNEGLIKIGIYRLKKSSDVYAEGVLITDNTDYPELFDMYR